jgi:hypothetical protein
MTTGYRRPVDADALAHNFRVFADADCAHEPLYATLSHAIAGHAETLELLMQAPYAQRRPVLLFASVHDLLLEGHAHPLARFYRSVATPSEWRDDVELAAEAFFDLCRARHERLAVMLAERSTQTNEVGRSAGLRLALSALDPARPIALIDVGCSAGLNLLVDRYRVEEHLPDGSTRHAGVESTVELVTDLTGVVPALRPTPPIARRVGLDRSPLDVRVARDARWLQACIWPSDLARHERLAAAVAIARVELLDLRAGDANALLAEVLAAIPADVRPVVFHSWVVSYFDGDGRRRFADAVRAMVAERDGAWISAEGPGVVPGLAAPPLPAGADAVLREATVWHLTTRDGRRALARSHPHCRWIDWLAD